MAIQVKPRGSNALETTVSDLSNRLKRTVEDEFGSVRVRGEISGYRGPVSSGHMYFTLKDDRSAIDAVVWKGVASKLAHRPEEGLEVIATGRLTIYPGRSKYQIVIDNLEPAGAGALMAQFERLRRKLAEEGLFAAERKSALPFMPRRIGVVTSPTGAVIRDILHRLHDRFPTHVMVWPVRVQGETTPKEVARAIMGFNRMAEFGLPSPDLLIVARGGGSLEDLWGFNDELVVRAAAASRIPLISAVGHETDTTLIDHASDFRAPTPTAAAERAVPVRADLEAMVADRGARLRGGLSRGLDGAGSALRAAERGLPSADMLFALPRRRFDEAGGRLDRALERFTDRARARFDRVADRLVPSRLAEAGARRGERVETLFARTRTAFENTVRRERERHAVADRALERAAARSLSRAHDRYGAQAQRLRLRPIELRAERLFERVGALDARLQAARRADGDARRARLEAAVRLLGSLSYQGVLERGFALVTDGEGAPVRSVKALPPGTAFAVRLADGRVQAVAGKAAKRHRPKPEHEQEPAQASLL